MNDCELAAHLAATAGKILLTVRDSVMFEGQALGKMGDQMANEFLIHALQVQRPDDGLLSEESADTGERLQKSRVWVIDPVDGTREYGEGRADWAVHVGLAVDGIAVLGAVALPGAEGGIVLRSDSAIPTAVHAGPPRLVVSRTRPAPEALTLAKALGGSLIAMGSAGAKAMAIVRGEAEIYLHSGGQYEWDSCAPVAVAKGHGLHCSRIDGSPLVYNQQDTSLPDVLICGRQWADQVLAYVREVAANGPGTRA